MNRAVFLDRDGTVNELVDGHAPFTISDFRLFPDSKKSVEKLKVMGFKTVIVSNQPDIARGLLKKEDLDEITNKVRSELPIDAVYYCMHYPPITEECECRKPKTGLIDMAANDLNIDVSNSFMVGDSPSDIEAGRNCMSIILISNGAPKHPIVIKPDFVVKSISDAVEAIRRVENADIH